MNLVTTRSIALRSTSHTLLPWLGLSLLIIVLDQIAKTVIIRNLQLGDSHTVTSREFSSPV